jgi:hypothetical protein
VWWLAPSAYARSVTILLIGNRTRDLILEVLVGNACPITGAEFGGSACNSNAYSDSYIIGSQLTLNVPAGVGAW